MKYFHIPAGIDAVAIWMFPGYVHIHGASSFFPLLFGGWHHRSVLFFFFSLLLRYVLALFFQTHSTANVSLLPCTSCFIPPYALAYFKFQHPIHIWAYENLMHGNPVWYTCYIPIHRPQFLSLQNIISYGGFSFLFFSPCSSALWHSAFFSTFDFTFFNPIQFEHHLYVNPVLKTSYSFAPCQPLKLKYTIQNILIVLFFSVVVDFSFKLKYVKFFHES